MKSLLDTRSDCILGVTMLDGGEVIAVVQTAVLRGLPYSALRDAIFIQPATAEGVSVLLTSGFT